jgi:hypothetical protein
MQKLRHEMDEERWERMTIFEQMGNAGAEVGRAMSAKKRGDNMGMMTALYRGVDLLNMTARLWARKKSPRVREILIARDQFIEAITEGRDDPGLETYFMRFALAARLNR